ncbi:MAG: acyltransferase [Rhizomicrobium sp.]
MADATTDRRIAILDGYRALAVLAVLLYHYTVRWAPPHDPSTRLPGGAVFSGFLPFAYGWLGVELFFIISGFVIAMTLARCRNPVDFALRRFARLWPPLLVAATLTTIVVHLIGPPEWQVNPLSYLTSILLLGPDVMAKLTHQPGIYWVDGAYWSLWVELRFYILAAIIYLFGRRRRFVLDWLVFQAALVLLSGIADRTGTLEAVPQFLLRDYLPYFTIGICVFEIYRKGLERRLALAGALFGGALVLWSAAWQQGLFEDISAPVSIVANLAIFALFALFLRRSPALRFFRGAWIVALGRASYSLYLIHQHIGIVVMAALIAAGLPYLAALPATIVLVVGAAFLLFRFVEVPGKALVLGATRGLAAGVDRKLPWLRYDPAPKAGDVPDDYGM